MKLLFKQRFFSWLDSYDIYDESMNVVYMVKGELSFGHCLKIYNRNGEELGTVKERIFTFFPKFEMYYKNNYIGCISKEFSFFGHNYNIDCNDWYVEGDLFGWEYNVLNRNGSLVANVSKQLFNWTDTYVIDVKDPNDALYSLMLVLAIDAEKCSKRK